MKSQMKLKQFAFDERSESMKAPVGLLSDRTVLRSKMKRLRLFKFFKQETVLSVAAVLAVLSMFFVPPDADYLGYIDLRTLAILFSLMTIMAGLRRQGVLTDGPGAVGTDRQHLCSWRSFWSDCASSGAWSSPTMFPC